MIEVATSLVTRLPCTLAALDSGEIDLYKAERVVKPTLEVSAEVVAPPASLARFIKARDRECLQPGCHRPAEFSEIDHIIPRARNGQTNHHHCRGYRTIHNLLRDEPGWDFIPRDNGAATVITPSGHTYLATPQPLHEPRPHPDDTPPF